MNHHIDNCTSSLPATMALNEEMNRMNVPSHRRSNVISPNSSLSSIDDLEEKQSFDMSELFQAAEPVDTPLSFPSIEWCNDDDDEADSTDSISVRLSPLSADDEGIVSLGKRSRNENHNGLSRKKSTNSSLSSLSSGPASAALESKIRSGSWGQLVSHNDFPTFSIGSSVSDEKKCTNKSIGYKKQLEKSSLRRCEGQLFMQKPCAIKFDQSVRILL